MGLRDAIATNYCSTRSASFTCCVVASLDAATLATTGKPTSSENHSHIGHSYMYSIDQLGALTGVAIDAPMAYHYGILYEVRVLHGRH